MIPAPVDLWATHPTPVQRIDFYDSRSFYPTRSSDRARIAATQFSTTFRTSPSEDALEQFRKQFEPFESNLHLFTDSCTEARFCECHVKASKLIAFGTVDAPLDPERQAEYKANRAVVQDDAAFLKMKQDAAKGRSFSNIVAEYTQDFDPEHPLKIIGGQHHFEAIRSASGQDKYHGIKVYVDLNKNQRMDVQLISNTNIEIGRDLIDRILETAKGPELRDWCQEVGLLKKGQDFTDRYRRGGPISVQMAHTFITNYHNGKRVESSKFATSDTTPQKCPSGKLDLGWEKLLTDNPDLLKDDALKTAARQFTSLIEAQRKAFAEKTPKPQIDYPEKALNQAVLAGWSYIAGHLQSNPKRLDRHYTLAHTTGHDPLNAAALAKGKDKTDPHNYRGLGSRTDPKEQARFVEIFYFQATESGGINKHAIEVGMANYLAKRAVLTAKKVLAKGN